MAVPACGNTPQHLKIRTPRRRTLTGELDEAMALLKEQERICQKLGDRASLSGLVVGGARW